VQVWCTVLSWYVEQRRYIENEVRKYSDPSSDRLLPDMPAHMRCALLADTKLLISAVTLR